MEWIDSFGSNEGWLHIDTSDTFAFDTSTRSLKMIELLYGEDNQVPGCLPLLPQTEKIVGTPRLTEPTEHFLITPFEFRHYQMENNRLLGFNEDFMTATDQFLELIVSDDLSMFFLNGRYCAWGLYHPEIRLVNRLAEVVEHPSDPFLQTALRAAFDLICDETVRKMNEKDEDALQQLATLHNRIAEHRPIKDSPLAVLNEWLFELADKFYWRRGIKGLFVGRDDE